jgi:CRP-like cAMP-binding protein
MTGKFKHYLRANANLNEEQLNQITGCFKAKAVKRGAILLAAGQICNEFYFVDMGCLRTYYLTKQGHEKTRYIAFDNAIITSISSFISQQPSFEYVDAIEDSELYSVSRKDFYQLVNDIPEWGKFYLTLLETAYLYQNKRIESLVTLSAKQRYEQVLKDTPVYIKRLSNKILASYLDITQETLSRLKSK